MYCSRSYATLIFVSSLNIERVDFLYFCQLKAMALLIVVSSLVIFFVFLQVLVLASSAPLGYSATRGSHSWPAFGRD